MLIFLNRIFKDTLRMHEWKHFRRAHTSEPLPYSKWRFPHEGFYYWCVRIHRLCYRP